MKGSIYMNSFISWIGGKKLLKNEILKMFPEEKIDRYIEVFGGAGCFFFQKIKYACFDVYNDHCGELQRQLSIMLNSRDLFYV